MKGLSSFLTLLPRLTCIIGLPYLLPIRVDSAVFLAQQLRQQQRLAPAGGIATTLTRELHLPLANGSEIPQLAFGLYKIPPTEEGEAIILQAVRAGYRHFDGAAFYQNEHILGRALRKTGLPREAFYITSKVWNDAVKGGRLAVKASVEKSLAALNFGHYFDLFFVHWPVPGHFVEAYQALEEVHHEGKIKALGLSNFDAQEYEQLIAAGLRVPPVCNQFEVSPVMYRADLVQYFMERKILVSASKPLNRAAAWNNPTLIEMGGNYQVTPAQVMIRWGVQKGLLVAAKTSTPARMQENRKVRHFALTEEDMQSLDALTTKEDLAKRAEHELMRKTSL
jgi:diketogulonate reductase-like aldo/keto reductase